MNETIALETIKKKAMVLKRYVLCYATPRQPEIDPQEEISIMIRLLLDLRSDFDRSGDPLKVDAESEETKLVRAERALSEIKDTKWEENFDPESAVYACVEIAEDYFKGGKVGGSDYGTN